MTFVDTAAAEVARLAAPDRPRFPYGYDRPGSCDTLAKPASGRSDRAEAAMTVILGPYPLCEACIATNGGLVGAAHPQVHVAAHDRESCVDIGLAGLLVALWAVCETRSCCEDDGGRAYVTPAAEDRDAAADLLAALGLDVEDDAGVLRFSVPPDARLGDAAWVRERLGG